VSTYSFRNWLHVHGTASSVTAVGLVYNMSETQYIARSFSELADPDTPVSPSERSAIEQDS
jgi:hypothetical protein